MFNRLDSRLTSPMTMRDKLDDGCIAGLKQLPNVSLLVIDSRQRSIPYEAQTINIGNLAKNNSCGISRWPLVQKTNCKPKKESLRDTTEFPFEATKNTVRKWTCSSFIRSQCALLFSFRSTLVKLLLHARPWSALQSHRPSVIARHLLAVKSEPARSF